MDDLTREYERLRSRFSDARLNEGMAVGRRAWNNGATKAVEVARAALDAFVHGLIEHHSTPDSSTPFAHIDAQHVARLFHEHYEAKAAQIGYETRADSRVPWESVPDKNKVLMVATVEAVLADLTLTPDSSEAQQIIDKSVAHGAEQYYPGLVRLARMALSQSGAFPVEVGRDGSRKDIADVDPQTNPSSSEAGDTDELVSLIRRMATAFREMRTPTQALIDTQEHANALDAVANEIARREAGDTARLDWRPIETAPKDGDLILTDGVQVAQGGWITDIDQGADYEGQLRCAGWWSVPGNLTPTHWMPLPSAPDTARTPEVSDG